ncbi:hypothetical protein QCA50_004410 [Cerrena zonata]|uniref:Uncharacterized protein n=1 Tax=Cerrena zonata TaxID=2478898 RepID=A0AAW0GLH7_9APHY
MSSVGFTASGPLPSGAPLTIAYPSYFGHQQGQVQLGDRNTTYNWIVDVIPGVPIQVTATDSGSVQQNVSTSIFTTSPNIHQLLCVIEDVGEPSNQPSSSIVPPAAFTGSVTVTAAWFGSQTSTSGLSSITSNQIGTPSTSTSPSPNDTFHKTSGKTIGFIVLGVVLGLLLVSAIVLLVLRRRRKNLKRSIDLLDEKDSGNGVEETLPPVTPFLTDETTSLTTDQDPTFERPNLTAHTGSTDRISLRPRQPNNDKKAVTKAKAGAVPATTSDSSSTPGDPDPSESSRNKELGDAAVLSVSRPAAFEEGSSHRREADAGIRLAGDEWVDDHETLPPAYADIRR